MEGKKQDRNNDNNSFNPFALDIDPKNESKNRIFKKCIGCLYALFQVFRDIIVEKNGTKAYYPIYGNDLGNNTVVLFANY